MFHANLAAEAWRTPGDSRGYRAMCRPALPTRRPLGALRPVLEAISGMSESSRHFQRQHAGNAEPSALDRKALECRIIDKGRRFQSVFSKTGGRIISA